MIEQGTDGLSRGDFDSEVMARKAFLSLVPLNKGALELAPGLFSWIRDMLPGRLPWEALSTEECYTKGHTNEHFIWAPPTGDS